MIVRSLAQGVRPEWHTRQRWCRALRWHIAPPRVCLHRLRDSELGILLPPVEKLALGTLADLAMPFCIALEIGPDTGTGPNGNLEQTRIGKHMRD